MAKFFKSFKKKLDHSITKTPVHRPKILADKLERIYAIVWEDNNNYVTPEEFKETLNMFRGKQLRTSLQDCLTYLKLSLAKQAGDIDAEKEMDLLHYQWNN